MGVTMMEHWFLFPRKNMALFLSHLAILLPIFFLPYSWDGATADAGWLAISHTTPFLFPFL
jgi:hypothetical protein